MSTIYIDTDVVKKKVIPNISKAISKINIATNIIQTLDNKEYYQDSNPINIVSLINKEKESCNKILKWLEESVNSYELYSEQNIPYIDKCYVEKVKDKLKKEDLK